ncbi:thiamine phosphate synthase [Blastopirellula sp. JC732]|uniref:Thiamine-phosphate synthase n=1 Tax=Blastopirellula sediminis TaxID=2894196 RepID=A0A9X1MTH2_9BACT|nr:thiamine phosphate synthase [Blastopirellula sediminis]MCC9604923.1 thiamine phosphate synthase [Blastopirellula sediminis]MCC9631777.1 thiamine phosphate synthase [Blastopirellula sediminis]
MSHDSQPANPHSTITAWRAIDAAANRAAEGLRVVEDFVRFGLDDRHLTTQVKNLRHDLTATLKLFSSETLHRARDTQADVGVTVSTEAEQARTDLAQIAISNLKRAQQSLRTLEEFSKLVQPAVSSHFEQLRYRSYTLEKAITTTRENGARLADARLYVLIDGGRDAEHFAQLAGELIAGGVDILQLRDKRLDDKTLLERARHLRKMTSESSTFFIVNDRVDIAALAGADGVHVGQEELSVKEARAILGVDKLVGVSTHSIEQARRAVLDGADYIGVGPTFPSQTKSFDQFPGLDLVRQVADEIRLPAFAIGGISAENVGQVIDAGLTRVAVSGAVAAAKDPKSAAAKLRAILQTD